MILMIGSSCANHCGNTGRRTQYPLHRTKLSIFVLHNRNYYFLRWLLLLSPLIFQFLIMLNNNIKEKMLFFQKDTISVSLGNKTWQWQKELVRHTFTITENIKTWNRKQNERVLKDAATTKQFWISQRRVGEHKYSLCSTETSTLHAHCKIETLQ